MPTNGPRSELVLHWPGSPPSFNPFSNLSMPSWFPIWFIFDQLVNLDGEARVGPQLAESWDVSADGRRYTFRLRSDVTWHDGAPFSAEDVAFTYTMLVDPRATSRYQSLALPIKGAEAYAAGDAPTVEGISVVDDCTVVMELAEPHFGFLATMAFPIVPRHILEGVATGERVEDTEWSLRSPVGTGPFRISSYEPGGDAVFVANEAYWGGTPSLDGLTLRRLDDEAALVAFGTGDIDVMFIDALDADLARERPGARVEAFRTCEWRTIIFNHSHPALGDRRVREAVVRAIDREAIIRDVYQGMGEVIGSPLIMPEWAVNHRLDSQYPYDPEGARALLAEAGFADGFRVELVTGPGAIPARHNAPFRGEVQRYLADIGIDLVLNIKPIVEYVGDYENSRFDVYTCCGASGPDPDFTAIYFHSSSMPPKGSNGARYVSAEADELLLRGRAAADPEERAAVYHRYAEVLTHDLPWAALWHENRVLALAEGVGGDFTELGMSWLPGTIPGSWQWSKNGAA